MLNPSRTPPPEDEQHLPLTHVEEQEILRRETIAAFHGAVDDQLEDDFLIPREKTLDEREREEGEYRAFLEREVGDLRDVVSVDGLESDEGSVKEEVEVNEDGKDTQGEKTKKKKKKKTKKAKDERDANNELSNGKQKKSKAEKDQEFLMKYVNNTCSLQSSIDHAFQLHPKSWLD
jgi:protein KRI1